MVNATNYNGMRGSVHYGRTNIWNRYHMNASFKAARTPPAALPMVTYTPVYQQPHCCGWDKAFDAIKFFAMGFGSGKSVTGNQQPMGMFGMGGMPGMMGGWNWFC